MSYKDPTECMLFVSKVSGQCQARLPVALILHAVFAHLPYRSGCGKAVLQFVKAAPVLNMPLKLSFIFSSHDADQVHAC